MQSATVEPSAKVKTYEDRCADLARDFAEDLDNVKFDSDDLLKLSTRIQADLNLADYKFKFRQADHVHQLLYGPWAVSLATLLVAVAVAIVGISQQQQRKQDVQAELVLKVLSAPPEKSQQLLTFLTGAGLLQLKPEQQQELLREIAPQVNNGNAH